MHADDPSVPGSETAYRRIARDGDVSMIVVDEATGERVVRSGAFCMDDDGCSVYLDSVLVENTLAASDLVRAPQNVVISVPVATIRAVELGIRPDPWPADGDGHRRDAAHALIVNHTGLGKKRRHKAFQRLASEAAIRWVPTAISP